MSYEELQMKYDDLNIIEMDLSGVNGLKGLYCNNNIAIEKSMTQTEKSCVLAEELGHYYTTTGNILDQSDIWNRKQEHRARMYGYDLLIGLSGIVQAYDAGCRNLYDTAEYLGVTEEYLADALGAYQAKYGICTTIDNYVIYFIPSLMVCKIIE